MEELTGRQFGSYRVVSALGQGGMAAIYTARRSSSVVLYRAAWRRKTKRRMNGLRS